MDLMYLELEKDCEHISSLRMRIVLPIAVVLGSLYCIFKG